DDDAVADGSLVGGGAVHRDHLGTFLGADRVGGEALAVIDVVDLDLLVFTDARQVQPLPINGTGAFVIEHRVRDFGTVQFGFEHDGLHGGFLIRSTSGG